MEIGLIVEFKTAQTGRKMKGEVRQGWRTRSTATVAVIIIVTIVSQDGEEAEGGRKAKETERLTEAATESQFSQYVR